MSAAYAGADVRESVVVSDDFVVVVWAVFACLCGVEFDAFGGLFVGAYESSAAAGGDDFVAVE